MRQFAERTDNSSSSTFFNKFALNGNFSLEYHVRDDSYFLGSYDPQDFIIDMSGSLENNEGKKDLQKINFLEYNIFKKKLKIEFLEFIELK